MMTNIYSPIKLDPQEKLSDSQLLEFLLERLVVQSSIGLIKDFLLVNRRDFSFIDIEILDRLLFIS